MPRPETMDGSAVPGTIVIIVSGPDAHGCVNIGPESTDDMGGGTLSVRLAAFAKGEFVCVALCGADGLRITGYRTKAWPGGFPRETLTRLLNGRRVQTYAGCEAVLKRELPSLRCEIEIVGPMPPVEGNEEAIIWALQRLVNRPNETLERTKRWILIP